MILLACDEHLSVVGYKTQEGYFLTPRADKSCLKCVDLGCRCEAHDVIVPSSRFYLTSDERASLVKIYTDLRYFDYFAWYKKNGKNWEHWVGTLWPTFLYTPKGLF